MKNFHIDTIVDARSEGEFELDHLYHAVNWPVLNNEKRIVVGSIDRQEKNFESKKIGSAVVATDTVKRSEYVGVD